MSNSFLHKLTVLLGAVMVAGGLSLGVYSITQLPGLLPSLRANSGSAARSAFAASPNVPASDPVATPARTRTDAESNVASDQDEASVATINAPPALALYLAADLPPGLVAAVDDTRGEARELTTVATPADAQVLLNWEAEGGEPVYSTFFAAATRFDTIDLDQRLLRIERAWQGDTRTFQAVVVLTATLPALTQLLGEPGASVTARATMTDVVSAAWQDRNILALVPFDQLTPQLAVYAVDGQTPVENAAKFIPTAYPLVATVYAHPTDTANTPSASAMLNRLTTLLPASNRDASRLTVVAMTGVTAMTRLTAEQMDERGDAWPAEVVGSELAAADITAISNEVPFVPSCETNTDEDNLVFCSKIGYMETLTASGADIVGLTGNHQNDYGLENALTSLEIYAEAGLPVYGGGKDKASAFAPLRIEHNGNRLAFLGANSYGPTSAWAGEFSPGSAPFDLAMMSATIRALKAEGEVDLVLTELQYQESYDVEPLIDQRLDFGALARAGADIVTGVQSHVPQAVEFVDGRLVLYGLGNLYFDQMWTEETREGLIVKHTIYAGRHISTQLLPTLLFDYGQPRWPDAERNAAILAKVFAASQWE